MTKRFNREDFLDTLFGDFCKKTGSFIMIRTSEEKTGENGATQFFPSFDTLSTAQFPANRHIFFGVCPRQRMRPAKEHIRFITALWAGIDVGPDGYCGSAGAYRNDEELQADIVSFPVPPSIKVRSGRGTHLYWLLDSAKEITNTEVVESLLSKLNKRFRCSAPVGLEAVLRLPDTLNPRPTGGAAKCYVEFIDPDLRYNPRDFQGLDGKSGGPQIVRSKIVAARQAAPTGLSPQPERPDPDPQAKAEETPWTADNEPAQAPSQARPQAVQVSAERIEQGEGVAETIEFEYVDEETDGAAGSLSDEQLDSLALMISDRLAERFLGGFSKRLVDTIVDQAVAKLSERLVAPNQPDDK